MMKGLGGRPVARGVGWPIYIDLDIYRNIYRGRSSSVLMAGGGDT